MDLNVAQKLIQSHLKQGEMQPGKAIAISIDQTLTQDATGTLVMLTLEALNLDWSRTELSVQYVDHNLIQEDFRNADDHLFLQSAARRFGLWYSRPGIRAAADGRERRCRRRARTPFAVCGRNDPGLG